MPDFTVILTPQFWIVAATCGAIGVAIKQIPKIPSWIIPLANLVIGAVLAALLLGIDPINFLAGVLAASVATYAYELFTKTVTGLKEAKGSGSGGIGGTD